MSTNTLVAVWPANPRHRIGIIVVWVISLLIGYGFRVVDIEISRAGYAGLIGLALECVIGVFGAALWAFLLLKAARALRGRESSVALLLAVIVAPITSVVLPLPPTREEIRLWQRRNEYEDAALTAFNSAAEKRGACVESDAVALGLSVRCLHVDTNSVDFEVFEGLVTLVYSVDEKPPTAVQCEWNGFVWKRIDSHWSICKEDVN